MQTVLVGKSEYIYRIDEYLNQDQTVLDAEYVLDTICRGIKNCPHDRTYVRNLVFTEVLFDGIHVFTPSEQIEMLKFFGKLRMSILGSVMQCAKVPNIKTRLRFVPNKSKTALAFEILQPDQQ